MTYPFCVLFVLLSFSFLPSTIAAPISCTAAYQCSTNSNYNYVACQNGYCACLTSQGFVGDPSQPTGCNCPSPASVTWVNNVAYCIDIVGTTASQARANARISQVQLIYTNLIYPTPLSILNGSVSLNNLFAPFVRGRVDPFGIFLGATLADYYYVFSANKGTGVTAVYFKHISYNDSDSTVAVRVDLLFSAILAPGVYYPITNLTESGIYRFAPNNTVVSVDAIVHNVGFFSNPSVVPAGVKYVGDRSVFVNQLCTDILNYCPPQYDPVGYYHNVTDCLNFMTNGSARVATYDEPNGNTDICRRYHATIARLFPDVHCVHAGKTGGDQCVDPPYYASYYSAAQQF